MHTLCTDSAQTYDGSWVWDRQPNTLSCVPDGQPCESVAGGRDRICFFSTAAAAAEEAAVQVWTAMLLAVKDPSSAIHGQLEKQAPKRRGAGRGSSKASKKQKQQQEQQKELDADAALAAAVTKFRKVSADGLPSWEAKISWFDNPLPQMSWPCVSNEVCSTIKVEVVPADLL
jgi:hypothetical protein